MKRLFLTLALLAAFAVGRLSPAESSVWRNPFLWSQLFTGVPVLATYTPTPFKSIQLRSVTMASAGTNNDTLPSSVSTTWTALVTMGHTWDATSAFNATACFLTSATNVACKDDPSAPSATGLVKYAVVEFLPGIVKSVQGCTIPIANAAATGTCTISSVSTTKTWFSYMGYRSTDSNGSHVDQQATVVQTSATVLTATRLGTTGAAEVSVFAIEGK